MGAFKPTLIADFLRYALGIGSMLSHIAQRPFVLRCKVLSAYMQGSELHIHM